MAAPLTYVLVCAVYSNTSLQHNNTFADLVHAPEFSEASNDIFATHLELREAKDSAMIVEEAARNVE